MLKSRYENYDSPNPYANPEERQFIGSELLDEYESNSFYKSQIPVVRNKKSVHAFLSTSAFVEPPNHYCKVSNYYYKFHLNNFDLITMAIEISKLNTLIKKHTSVKYCFNILKHEWKKKCEFVYNYEKNFFRFTAYTEKAKHDSVSIEYDEDGIIKKALVNNTLSHGIARSTFKHYKDGFDLYMVTYDDEIKYRRSKK